MKDICIVADDCWGTGVYTMCNQTYSSPFVNLFIHTPCYIKLLKNFDDYIIKELKFININESKYTTKNNYVVGILDDIEIHFSHFMNNYSVEKVKEMWNKRLQRMSKNIDDIIFKIGNLSPYRPQFYDKDYEKYLNDFYNLPFKKKVSFTVNKYEYENNYKMLGEHNTDAMLLGKHVNDYFNIRNFNE